MNISEGGTRRWRSQGIGNVTRSKEYRKERSAEDIIGSVLGTLRVKCLCYFNIHMSKKTPISLEFKKPFFFFAVRGLSLLWPLPLRSTGSRRSGSVAMAPRHVGSSRTGARTRIPCIDRWTLNHCATREAPIFFLIEV